MGTRGDASRHLRTLARDVRRARELLGWSQGDLARAARVGQATISRLERGTCSRMPYVTVLRVHGALAGAFRTLGDQARIRGVPMIARGLPEAAVDVTLPALDDGLADLARMYGQLGEAERVSLIAVVRALAVALHA
ncbi:MAG: helix-turn-helix domain-containing protein [bacterium]|nr:helix-turn-helix domain-containing protein [bacterium]